MSDHHLSAVIEACKHITNSGSTPSVGLIRAKLLAPVPLPEMIRGLKYWQANPVQAEIVPAPKVPSAAEPVVSNSTEMQALYQRIEVLEMMITNLQTEVQALKKQ